MTTPLTPLRDLTAEETAHFEKLRAIARAHETGLNSLLAELVVTRGVIRKVRHVMRCQPQDVRRALDGLPNLARKTSMEYTHD